MDEQLAANRSWFETYCVRLNEGVHEEPAVGTSFKCPCCLYPTLTERGGYEICPLCNWEDDGQDDPHASELWGGPNGRYSLTLARENFKAYLVMYSPDNDTRGFGPDTDMQRAAKRVICSAFDQMNGADLPTREQLAKIVETSMARLDDESARKADEHDTRQTTSS